VPQARQAAEEQAASARAEAEAARSKAAHLQSSAQGIEAAVHRLIELMYFAAVGRSHHTLTISQHANHKLM
jgi:hypothetical protein